MKKISLKYKILICVLIIIIFIGLLVYFIYQRKDEFLSHIGSSNISLDEKNYKGSIELSGDVNIIFVINKDNKVSNIIFLDKSSINSLANKKIEGKNISDAMYDVINLLNENNLLTKNIILTNYQNNDCLNLIEENINKNLIIFGSHRTVSENSKTLKEKVESLNLESKDKDLDNVKVLYNYGRDLLLNESLDSTNEDISYLSEAQDIFRQLDKYAKGEMEGYKIKVENQQKDDPNGLIITDIKSESGLTPTSKSWYTISNYNVVADIDLDGHEYCFKDNVNNYIESACP